MPVPYNAFRVLSEMNVGARSTTSRTSAGMPSWVAAMLRHTLARPRTFITGAATDRGSDPAVDTLQANGFRRGQVECLAVATVGVHEGDQRVDDVVDRHDVGAAG